MLVDSVGNKRTLPLEHIPGTVPEIPLESDFGRNDTFGVDHGRKRKARQFRDNLSEIVMLECHSEHSSSVGKPNCRQSLGLVHHC